MVRLVLLIVALGTTPALGQVPMVRLGPLGDGFGGFP
jgi:hypothetical protein